MNTEVLHPELLHAELNAESHMGADTLLVLRHRDAVSPGVSWGAVLGGAAVAAALSMILLALGAGFGLSAISPWTNVGMSAAAVGWMAIVWLVVTEMIASSMGGYLAGRLRTRWHAIHSDEVHFRDTANGFLVWAVAVIATFVFLAGAASTMAGTVRTGAAVNSTSQGSSIDPQGYYITRMFRADHPTVDIGALRRSEVEQIFAHTVLSRTAPPSDTTYLAQLVAASTGLSSDDALKRVNDTLYEAWQAEDAARRATAHVLLWSFLALLTGAFCASYAATVGGRQRDRVEAV